MYKPLDTRKARARRHRRIRVSLSGSAERPRLSVFRSLQHIYAQIVDDTSGTTLAAASTLDPALRPTLSGPKAACAGRKRRAKDSRAIIGIGYVALHNNLILPAFRLREGGEMNGSPCTRRGSSRASGRTVEFVNHPRAVSPSLHGQGKAPCEARGWGAPDWWDFQRCVPAALELWSGDR